MHSLKSTLSSLDANQFVEYLNPLALHYCLNAFFLIISYCSQTFRFTVSTESPYFWVCWSLPSRWCSPFQTQPISVLIYLSHPCCWQCSHSSSCWCSYWSALTDWTCSQSQPSLSFAAPHLFPSPSLSSQWAAAVLGFPSSSCDQGFAIILVCSSSAPPTPSALTCGLTTSTPKSAGLSEIAITNYDSP